MMFRYEKKLEKYTIAILIRLNKWSSVFYSFLKHGADIVKASKDGTTPLGEACFIGAPGCGPMSH